MAWATFGMSNTFAVDGTGVGGNAQMEVRNVTAVVNSGNGIGVGLAASGGDGDTMLVRNVIAHAPGTGFRAFAAGSGNSANIDLDYSSFNDCAEAGAILPTPTATKGPDSVTTPASESRRGGDIHHCHLAHDRRRLHHGR